MNYKKNAGFLLVEIVVVIALVVVLVPAANSLLSSSIRSMATATRDVEAAYLAQETLEAVRTLRDESWSLRMAPLLNSTSYYLVLSGGKWTLSTTNPGLVSGLYTRVVTFESVLRDGNGDIVASGGTLDPNTRHVTAVISWPYGASTRSVTMETYLTNFLQN